MSLKDINTKYCLHDCIIDKVEVESSKLIFYISKGIYEKELNTGEYKETGKCHILIEMDDFDEAQAYEHISINVFRRNVRKNISFEKFCELVLKRKFIIYLDFYSNFAKGLLIKGHSKKQEVELLITEIRDIQLIF